MIVFFLSPHLSFCFFLLKESHPIRLRCIRRPEELGHQRLSSCRHLFLRKHTSLFFFFSSSSYSHGGGRATHHIEIWCPENCTTNGGWFVDSRLHVLSFFISESLGIGTLFMSGDLLCQAIEKKKGEPYDWMRSLIFFRWYWYFIFVAHLIVLLLLLFFFCRTARMTVFGVGVMGPAAYYWYHLIDRVFPSRDYSVVLRKVFLDQAVFSPPYYSTFFFIMPLLEGIWFWDRTERK